MWSFTCLDCAQVWSSTGEDDECPFCGSPDVDDITGDAQPVVEACGRGICARVAGHEGPCDY